MTFLIRCDNCGKIQEADDSGIFPCNPINPITNEKWWSRVKDGKHEHACQRSCLKDGVVSPI